MERKVRWAIVANIIAILFLSFFCSVLAEAFEFSISFGGGLGDLLTIFIFWFNLAIYAILLPIVVFTKWRGLVALIVLLAVMMTPTILTHIGMANVAGSKVSSKFGNTYGLYYTMEDLEHSREIERQEQEQQDAEKEQAEDKQKQERAKLDTLLQSMWGQ